MAPMTPKEQDWNERLEREVYQRTLALQDSLKRLEALNSMRAQFVAIMSHELRTPATALIGYADTLKEKWAKLPEKKIQKYLDVISEESSRMVTLMQEIFEISRILEGKLSLQFQTADLIPLIGSAVKEFRLRYADKSFGFKETADSLEAKVDTLYFKSALTHVLLNAVKYTPDKGNILLFVESKGGEAVIRIEDDGPGIPREYREKAFEPFFRSMDNVNRKTPGAGLGLTIARGVIEAFKGRVVVADKLTGKQGCAVVISIPLAGGSS
ncbi:MAG: hypothetical protein A2901_08815 [Elusimicrobia bacterium RIFCSPLOWO2_01_FULL_54_10]|nr:MAG: hypothetical protein A2901_08815 [Elusimicrobia bacterium RIFCSPLOWO2_01_FULL_54_10]